MNVENYQENIALLQHLHTSALDLQCFKAPKRQMTLPDNREYKVIDVFGDGNCGLYAFAVGLIKQIQANEAVLHSAGMEQLFLFLLDQRNIKVFQSRMYTFHQDYKNLALMRKLEAIKELLESKRLDQTQFIGFIKKQQTPEEIAALACAMAHALRLLGVQCYTEEVKINLAEMQEDKRLTQDRAWIGDEILIPLGKKFGISVKLYDFVGQKFFSFNFDQQTPMDPSTSRPESDACMTLLRVENSHWEHCLSAMDPSDAFCQPLSQPLLQIFTEDKLDNDPDLKNLFDLVITLATLLHDVQNKYIEHGESYRDIYLASLGMYETLVKNIVANKNDLKNIQNLQLNKLNTDLRAFEASFKKHRGWYACHPIVRQALGVLALLTIIPALVTAATKRGYKGTFFQDSKDVKTASAVELDVVKTKLSPMLSP